MLFIRLHINFIHGLFYRSPGARDTILATCRCLEQVFQECFFQTHVFGLDTTRVCDFFFHNFVYLGYVCRVIQKSGDEIQGSCINSM
jgi:hypothetical protein